MDADWRLWMVDVVIAASIGAVFALVFPFSERGSYSVFERWLWSLAFGLIWILWFEAGCLLRRVRIGERGISRHTFSMGYMGIDLGIARIPLGPTGYYGLFGSSVVNWREVTRIIIEPAHGGSNSLWFPVLTVGRKYQRPWRSGLSQTGPLLTLAAWLRQRGTNVVVVEPATGQPLPSIEEIEPHKPPV